MPNVSVIIPTYKRAHLVSQAIESVLTQTYTDYEIIVVNDGSPDNTKQVLASFGDQITAIHQENLGVAAARNAGIMAASGRYIAFVDDDDVWLPNKLEKQIACLESNPKIGLVYSDMFCFNDQGFLPDTWAKAYSILPFEPDWSLFVRNCIPTPSVVVVRRECLEAVGGFDETLMCSEDYDLWLRISEKFFVYFLNLPLTNYRISANSLSSRENQELIAINLLRVQEKAYKRNTNLQKLPLMVLDQCFYMGYLRLAYFYIQRYQGQKARSVLAYYRQLRGMTTPFEWLWMISFPILGSSPTSLS